MRFTHFRQHDQMDCGPTCLKMVAKYYGRNFQLSQLRDLCRINKDGVSLLSISDAAEKIGFLPSAVRIHIDELSNVKLPCILHWKNNHFVVLYKVRKGKCYIADPSSSLTVYSKDEFTANWVNNADSLQGIALLLHPSPKFHRDLNFDSDKINWSIIFEYVKPYRKLVIRLLLGLLIVSLMQLVTPFLTQSVVDIGINTKNINFIYIILIAQITLFLGATSVNFVRSWITLHITSRINISILNDFLAKLLRLPIIFFDTRMTGDIMQRMNDHRRIETFLSGAALNTLFSFINLLVFFVALGYYSKTALLIFAVSSVTYTVWILLFMKRRRDLDTKHFDIASSNQSNLVELISGIQEIKLHNLEQQKRWQWERIQAQRFKFGVKSLALSQYQQIGSIIINQGKNILISFISARAVIEDELTLGGMMAIQFMVGQLNSPIEQLLGMIQSFQDAKISIERLNEVHQMGDEEQLEKQWISHIPADHTINLKNITFTYPGAAHPILENFMLTIQQGKTTAIVGTSGSGKTTILKLLLRFYTPESGQIRVGDINLDELSFRAWRNECGMVLQEGFIFSDTIAKNIALSDDNIDWERLRLACRVANVEEFIESLPLGYRTKIGTSGNGISQGQKQRLLIARVVYKNPAYIFFDEATNSLDSDNESIIMKNLQQFFTGKTVVIVAHRLSTVKAADNIVVLNKGRIIEEGTHQQLTSSKGTYYKLVKNQLEVLN